MAIPTFDNGTELRHVRQNTINPLVNKVNERFQDVIPVSGTNKKCIVDYRKYDITNPSGEAFVDFNVDLESNEYPVRGVISSIRAGTGEEMYVPSDELVYDRTTKTLDVEVGGVKDGHIWIEFWKEI